MKYETLCNEIIENIGGKDNVVSVSHCVTRLRFKLVDESKANTEAVSAIKGVMQVIQTGGQYQVVIGAHVGDVYEELVQIGGFSATGSVPADPGQNDTGEEEKKGILSRFLVIMSGVFQPVLSILMASGMIKALLVLLTLIGVLDSDSGTYTILYAMGDTIFYFFPVAVGWSAARIFGMKDIYGIILGAVLTYPTLVDLSSGEALYTVFAGTVFESEVYTQFLGIPVILPSAGYASSVIPSILIAWFASLLYKFLNKNLPSILRSFFTPFLTLLVSIPVGFVIIGPVAILLQGIISAFINWVISLNTGLAGLVIGSLWSILVMFGLHMPIIALFNVNIATYGYDVINPLIFSGALASMGSVLGVYFRCKGAEEKSLCLSSCISSFFGINEPALYGVLIPRKKTMISCFLSAGIGSMIAGFCGAKLWNVSTSGPLGIVGFINPDGIDLGFIGLCIGAVVSFVLAFATSWFFGPEKDENPIQMA